MTERLPHFNVPWEVGNALSALFKRRRLDLNQAKGALTSYAAIPIRLPDVDLVAAVAMAERHNVYAYDAYLVECARRYQTPLLSLDRRQCDIAREEGVEIMKVPG